MVVDARPNTETDEGGGEGETDGCQREGEKDRPSREIGCRRVGSHVGENEGAIVVIPDDWS